MVKGKVAGVIFGGFAGFLLVNKAFNVFRGSVHDVCEAATWRSYYRYGKDGTMVPPGYSQHVRSVGDQEIVTEKKKSAANRDASGKASNESFSAQLAKTITDAFVDKLKPEGAKEAQTEGNTEDKKDICPRDCKNCLIRVGGFDCPWESMRPNGGIIAEWDENGNPVSGRYPWSKDAGDELCWTVETRNDIPAQEETEPFYVDDLIDGVKIADEEETDHETLD